MWDDDLMTSRSWAWLARRITAILDCPPMTIVPYAARESQKFVAIPATRLGYLLNPPTFE